MNLSFGRIGTKIVVNDCYSGDGTLAHLRIYVLKGFKLPHLLFFVKSQIEASPARIIDGRACTSSYPVRKVGSLPCQSHSSPRSQARRLICDGVRVSANANASC